jgi:hypothetical protein
MPESADRVIPDRTPAWVTAWIVRADVRSSSEPAGGLDDRPTAHVRSERAAPYAKQLVEHLGRRVSVGEESTGRRLVFDDGDCLVSSTATELVLTVNTVDSEARAFVEDVGARRLERFAASDELSVRWEVDASGPATVSVARRAVILRYTIGYDNCARHGDASGRAAPGGATGRR